MLELMKSHDYMHDYARRNFGKIVMRTGKSRRAVMLTLLLISEPISVDNEMPELSATASYAEIAKVAGVSEQVVRQAIPHLVKEELIEIEPSIGDANTYVFL